MTPAQKHKIRKIVPFILLWGFAGLLYTLVERGLMGDATIYPATGNLYDFTVSLIFTTIGASLLGLVLGSVEVLFLPNAFRNRSLGAKIILKTLLYVGSIIIFLLILTSITNTIRLVAPIYDPVVIESITGFVTNFAFWSIVIYASTFVFIGLFLLELSENIGQNALTNFLTGKYHKPKIEERIFMFLDMRSSTSIAEKLGHVKYYELLNLYFKDISKAIIKTYGEVYQYAGDEVIISWDTKAGLKNTNCIECFFEAKDMIDRNQASYQERFGVIPSFKAGIHCGSVTTGEIGELKKEIVFTGDVLNTTARLQSLCNGYGVDLLISGELKEKIISRPFKFEGLGNTELRGRNKQIELYTIQKLQ